MDQIRRNILTSGAAATVVATAPRVFAQATGQGGVAMSFYEKAPFAYISRKPAPAFH